MKTEPKKQKRKVIQAKTRMLKQKRKAIQAKTSDQAQEETNDAIGRKQRKRAKKGSANLLHRLHFELYNREDKEHLSIPSLSLLPPSRHQRRQNEPVRVLHTLTLPPHSKKLVSVSFPAQNGQTYVLEHTDTLNCTVDTDPALVEPMSTSSQPWTVYNTGDKAIRLEEGAILGYAAQIDKIYGEDRQRNKPSYTHSVGVINSGEDASDMPFTMAGGSPVDLAPQERINELLQQVQGASAGMNDNL
ncbi:hypothetical protein QR680_017411 [Steinernema hermaphroditum]|uniref:Uncharacterized protein n=1 Tax=Steinernema hermaphroditum TaxID=289476 RepID=A0AA39HEG2_9BILA|nr:hypothetical protein QR680_017411 [Steinernema hermaphroditum]